jgi:hypothetical protein
MHTFYESCRPHWWQPSCYISKDIQMCTRIAFLVIYKISTKATWVVELLVRNRPKVQGQYDSDPLTQKSIGVIYWTRPLECHDFSQARNRFYNVNSLKELFNTIPSKNIIDYLK